MADTSETTGRGEAGSATQTRPSSWPARARQLTPLLPFGVLLLVVGLWGTQADRLMASKDWRLYHDTATLLLAGRIDRLYPGITPGLPFFYPPFFVWQVLPLGLVPRELAYGAVVITMVLATFIALWALRAALDAGRRRSVESWLWFVLSSAGWTWMVVTGHIAAWYLMLLSVALLLWARGRPIAAGVALSLLLSKPHYALVILFLAALARAWRIVLGATLGAALLALSSYPLGWSAWTAWLAQIATAGHVAFDAATAWKQLTLRAFWTACLGGADWRVTALWLATAAPVAALASWSAWRSRRSPDRLPRVLGLGVLVGLACGPYAFHYDGLLLAVPGLVWYFCPGSYRVPWARAGAGAMILTTYLLQHLDAWVLQMRAPLTAFAIAAWLVLDAIDLACCADPGDDVAPASREEALAPLA